LGETTGYVIEWQNRPVAAVEVINDGSVRLHPELAEEHRRPVVAAIAALLLYEELRATFPE
jgi:hypothetical protein